MSDRGLTAAVVVVAAVVLMAPAVVFGQASDVAPEGWTMPRTQDGQPDLQGVWANNVATPLERPEELAEQDALTDEELAGLKARAGTTVRRSGRRRFR